MTIPSLFNGTVSASACSAATIPYPTLFGAEFLSLEANYVANYTENISIGFLPNGPGVDVVGADFCNVTTMYTHPGQNDTIKVEVWLPIAWNGRIQAVGGGGWVAGLDYSGIKAMTASMGLGYATVGTDAGLGTSPDYVNLYSNNPSSWALVSEGNVNMYLLENFASISLNESAAISKAVVQSFYGTPAVYSYFTGCSGGGRQGYMIAQEFPDAFDGIAASAPAINWPRLFAEAFYPMVLMDELKTYPRACEFNAITQAAIDSCDADDGLVDGIITDFDCSFNASSAVGTSFNCSDTGEIQTISANAATIMQALWDGVKYKDNSSFWYGIERDAIVTGSDGGLITTTCSANGTCDAVETELFSDWLRYFIFKDSNSSVRNIPMLDFQNYAHESVQKYDSIIGTDDPDLSNFRDAGGKLLSYHGQTDALIPPHGTTHYFDEVTKLDANVHDYYRLFLAPGLPHCFGGDAPYPDTAFEALRTWVEDGEVPDVLLATSVTTPTWQRNLCPYPQQQYYTGTGNGTSVDDFYCK